jgi:hypothetical protein
MTFEVVIYTFVICQWETRVIKGCKIKQNETHVPFFTHETNQVA